MSDGGAGGAAGGGSKLTKTITQLCSLSAASIFACNFCSSSPASSIASSTLEAARVTRTTASSDCFCADTSAAPASTSATELSTRGPSDAATAAPSSESGTNMYVRRICSLTTFGDADGSTTTSQLMVPAHTASRAADATAASLVPFDTLRITSETSSRPRKTKVTFRSSAGMVAVMPAKTARAKGSDETSTRTVPVEGGSRSPSHAVQRISTVS